MAHLLLSTGRLTLRPFCEADLAGLQRIGNLPEVARMMGSIALPWTCEAVGKWVASSAWQGDLGFRLGIFDDGDRLVGAIGLERDPAALSYLIAPQDWGRGYASEAVGALLDFAFGRFSDLGEIRAEHLDDNPASGAVLRKFGFAEDATGPAAATSQSTCWSPARVEAAPSTVYRLTRQAYEAQHDEIS